MSDDQWVGPKSEDDIFVEFEVEYVRTEKFMVWHNPEKRGSNHPMALGGFNRFLNYYMHAWKSLIRCEKPRLVKWRVTDVDYNPYEGRDYTREEMYEMAQDSINKVAQHR